MAKAPKALLQWDKASLTLVWHNHPHGGQYASYKLGTIFRYHPKGQKGYKYWYMLAFNKSFNAKTLAEAKKRISEYSDKRIRELQNTQKKAVHQNKK